MLRLNEKGVKKAKRPSGHAINQSFDKVHTGGSIPSNVIDHTAEDFLVFGNNSANDKYIRSCKEAGFKVHPARFPPALPEFFIKLLTDEGDIVIDPFAGSNTTGMVAERLQRRWLAFDNVENYLVASKFRFDCFHQSE
jgi:site-specific DNA-methyltransferase (cytosine-N4-specific)